VRRRCQDDRQAVLAAADDHDLGVGRLRKLKRGFDAAPAHVGIGNALRHRLLEVADAVRLDRLALGFLFLALDAVGVLLDQIVLLDFAVDRRVDRGR
jgi:hypothetical protein